MDPTRQSTADCPYCGHRNDSEAKFCNQCGRRLGGICPNCRAENPPGSRFCNNCGRPLAAEPETNGRSDSLSEPSTPGTGPEPLSPTPGSTEPRRPLGVPCPRCQERNEPDSLYCYNCGLPLRGEAGFAGGPSPAPMQVPAFRLGAPGGFWRRLVAYLIDYTILLGAFALIGPLFVGTGLADYLRELGMEDRPLLTEGDTLLTAMGIVYGTVAIAAFATTVGKRALGMYVVQVDGSRVGLGRSLARSAGELLSSALFGIGYLIIAFRRDKRGLHDLIAGTVVIRRR